MKKILNDPNETVEDMLEGLVLAYPEKLQRLPETTVVTSKKECAGNWQSGTC